MKWLLAGGLVLGLALIGYTQLSLFVVQPIGALPEGHTLLLWRRSVKLNFVDSADGFCQRESKGVSLLCRAAALGAVIDNNPILLRMPYSSALYSLSTDGAEYDR